MAPVAPRRLLQLPEGLARGALRIGCLWLAALVAAGAPQGAEAEIVAARYGDPTGIYPHAILGDGIEHSSLLMEVRDGRGKRLLRVRLPEDRVFEDTAPRLADLDGDGDAEVIVVETDVQRGAQLAVYDETGKIAQTPHIGSRFRWLAPVGAADLDGDGRVEIAYIDRPHLARILRVWRFESGALTLVAELAGLTNHRIGETDIAGGIRDCGQGQGPEMITANADWSRIISTRLEGGVLRARPVGAHRGRASFRAAMAC